MTIIVWRIMPPSVLRVPFLLSHLLQPYGNLRSEHRCLFASPYLRWPVLSSDGKEAPKKRSLDPRHNAPLPLVASGGLAR